MKTKHLLFAIIPLVMAGCGLFKSADDLYNCLLYTSDAADE